MIICVICFLLLMSLLKNKLKLVTVVFQKYRTLFSQIGKCTQKKVLQCLQCIKIHETMFKINQNKENDKIN